MSSIHPVRRRSAVLGLFAAAVCFSAPAVHGHPGHGKPLQQEQAVVRAKQEIARLAGSGKLEQSWAQQAKLQSAQLRTYGRNKEWAITFGNDKAADPSRRTLYVFLTHAGEYLAANFTGE